MLIYAIQRLEPHLASLRILEGERFLLATVDTCPPTKAGGSDRFMAFFEIWHVEVKPDPHSSTGRTLTPLECLIHLRFEGPLEQAAAWLTARLQEQIEQPL